MIKTKQEVEAFLGQFGIKFDVWGIFYLDRDKNEEALKALGITPKARDEIVRQLQSDDYVETLPADFFDEMWVFGRDMDGTELIHQDCHGAAKRPYHLHFVPYRGTSN